MQSNIQVKYISSSINGDNFKFLKTKNELAKLDEFDDNVFKDNTDDYYIMRPESLANIVYMNYYKKYEIILKGSKRRLPIKSKKLEKGN